VERAEPPAQWVIDRHRTHAFPLPRQPLRQLCTSRNRIRSRSTTETYPRGVARARAYSSSNGCYPPRPLGRSAGSGHPRSWGYRVGIDLRGSAAAERRRRRRPWRWLRVEWKVREG
jgi:hypothetical protein